VWAAKAASTNPLIYSTEIGNQFVAMDTPPTRATRESSPTGVEVSKKTASANGGFCEENCILDKN
jgi:hypothetical protein